MKAYSTEIASAFEPIASAFETSFTGVIQGTQTIGQAWKKMIDSMGLELLKSGLHDLLMGGAKNTIGASIFGETGAGGGIAGALATAFQGSAIATGMKSALSTAWTGMTGIVGTVFGGAFRGIAGILHSVFGTALQGAASAGAGAAASTGVGAAASGAGAITTGLKELFSAMTMAVGYLATMATTAAAHMAVDVQLLAVAAYHAAIDVASWAVSIAQDAAYYAQSLADFIMEIITTATSVHPFGFSGGGIVPSAAGGMISPGGLSILHPNEMILPANLSEFVQRAAAGATGGGSGGGGIVINYAPSVQALDSTGVDQVLRRHSQTISDMVAQKVRAGRFTGQGVNRGAFRR